MPTVTTMRSLSTERSWTGSQQTAQRTNNVMRVLTVISSILLPAVVIAGIMGMNFKAPIFDDPANFYLVLVATAVLAISILAIARWRRWI